MRLTHTKIRDYRQQVLRNQNNLCGLCGDTIEDDAVLDHDHRTGRIRKVLHRGCNALLGKIENNMARNRVDVNRLEQIASNLASYISTDWTDVIHPTYKSQEARAKIRNKPRRAKCQ